MSNKSSFAKILLFTLLVLWLVDPSYASNDRIIFRDGRIEEVEIDQVSDVQLRYRSKHNKKVQQSVRTKDVYMYTIDSYGNTYVTKEGKRFSGEVKPVGNNVDVIYLVSGKEIGVESITRYPDAISYVEKRSGKKNKKEALPVVNLDNSQVFMICFKNGMTELVTPLDLPEEVVEEDSKKEDEVAQEEQDQSPQYTVVFHEVKKGDTIAKVAEKYGVSEAGIREWNEIPSKTKSGAQLKIGTNLMIYVEKK